MSQSTDTATSTTKQLHIGRMAPLVAVVAVLSFTPTLMMKGQHDGWHGNNLPWATGHNRGSGVTGDAMADASRELRVGIDRLPTAWRWMHGSL